jgi:hypothetical protein
LREETCEQRQDVEQDNRKKSPRGALLCCCYVVVVVVVILILKLLSSSKAPCRRSEGGRGEGFAFAMMRCSGGRLFRSLNVMVVIVVVEMAAPRCCAAAGSKAFAQHPVHFPPKATCESH